MKSSDVIIEKKDVYKYPTCAPFRPSVLYPEAPTVDLSNEKNDIYPMVRDAIFMLHTDDDHFGLAEWNPLGYLIKPGDTVLIKPNLVMDFNGSGLGTDCLYTNPSVVAAVLDYVYIALKGKGNIIVGDAPMQECKFEKLIDESGYKSLIDYCNSNYEGVYVQLIDFRDLRSRNENNVYVYDVKKESDGVIIDLGEDSEFAGISEYESKNIRITNYDPDILATHHNAFKHEYCVNKNVLSADVIINMPKPKTHRKAGVTIALKNLVGINARKEFLPHHTKGAFSEGGDEYLQKSIIRKASSACYDMKNKAAQTKKSRIKTQLWLVFARAFGVFNKLFLKEEYSEGSWYGNHTISRTIVDLNKILLYADKKGKMCENQQRGYLIVADMIISGEKEGPIAPSPKNVGIIAVGKNPVHFDRLIATLMGADINLIPTLSQLDKEDYRNKYVIFSPEEEHIVSNDAILNGLGISSIPENSILDFIPTSGWSTVFN